MKYYIIAGEASGDLHGSNLIKEIKKLDGQAQFRCWGGDRMQEAGAVLVKHIKELAFMGFKEVLVNLKTILNNIDLCKQDIIQYQPDIIIFIDYPGFNLRLAKFAKEQNFKTVYYIAPQVWAWKEKRVEQIKKYIDLLMVILPFEVDFFKKHQMEVLFTGHPLLDAIKDFKPDLDFYTKNNLLPSKPIVALLPGSRRQEIAKMLPVMEQASAKFPDYEFVVAMAPNLSVAYYQSIIGTQTSLKMISSQTYQLLYYAHAALVTSGTATLEAALFNVPEVVCYKGSWLSYQIGMRLVKIPYISLVNLILNKPCVKELIQNDFHIQSLEIELRQILDGEKRKLILNDYIELQKVLGSYGASKKAAEGVWQLIENQ